MESFIAFFKDHLDGLHTTYSWPVGTKTQTALPDFAWHSPSGTAAECIEMKQHLTRKWKNANPDEQRTLAKWIVSDWGGVRSNREGKIDAYVSSIQNANPPSDLQGVASYSKILSVVDCTNYAIYDARVAAALNAVQLLYLSQEPRYFPQVPSRNNIIINFNKRFADITKKENRAPISRVDAYTSYCTLLQDLKAHFPETEIYHFEMTLFSLAPMLCKQADFSKLNVNV